MVRNGTSINQKTQSVSVTAPAFIFYNKTERQNLVICKSCICLVIGSNTIFFGYSSIYLENYLENISPEVSNLARTLFCIFPYLFCCSICTAVTFVTILSVCPLVTNSITTNLIVILVTSIH